MEDASANSGHQVPRRAERHLRRRRLRAGARLRRDRARRRRELGGQPAGDAAARRAARHRRPDARRRQAEGAARSRRRLRHGRRRRARASARSSGGWSTRSIRPASSSERVAERAQELAAKSDRPATGPGITLDAARRRRSPTTRIALLGRRRRSIDRDEARRDADGHGARTRPSRPRRRRSSRPAISSGRCARSASWTTRCCGCACQRAGDRHRSSLKTRGDPGRDARARRTCCSRTRTTGSCARSCTSSSAR